MDAFELGELEIFRKINLEETLEFAIKFEMKS